MTGPHPPIEEFERIVARAATDPDRIHLESCDRCRAMQRMLNEFISPGSMHEAGLDEAQSRLDAIVAGIVGADAAAPRELGRILPFPATVAPPRRGVHPGLIGLAACVALATVVVFTLKPAGTPQLRGEGAAGTIRAMAQTVDGGAVRLNWDAFPGATRYRIVVLDSHVDPVADLGPVTTTTFTIPADSLAAITARTRAGEKLVWQVEALAGQSVIGYSGYRRLSLAGH